jgi:phosphoribosylformimino-5-aminoimidazole carboxamide ribotide isomerase
VQVIVTSFLFPGAKFSQDRLEELLRALNNDPEKLVIDLSCRRHGDRWFIATDKWQTVTDVELNEGAS